MKILLVEDNPTDRMFISHSLRQVEGFDYELVECDSLNKALTQACASPFDVILLDLWLPDSEGLDTCHRLVAAIHEIPIVVMTGTDDRTLAAEAIRSGAQDYLVKGAFPGSAVARVLQYAIDRFRFQCDRVQHDNHVQQVLSRVPAIIWTTDRALKINSAMGAGMQHLQLDPQQVIGMTLEQCFRITGDPTGAIKAHQRAMAGESISYETDWLGKSFEVKINPLYEVSHEVSGTIGVALDVTERRKLDREISCARMVQEALLPSEHPRLQGYDIHGGSYPATQTCGDWFDYLTLPDGSLGLVVGDISGHGLGPAILSATLAAYLEVLAESHSDVHEILVACNRLVCKRSLDGQFAILSLARLQPDLRRLTFEGAGEEMHIIGRDGRLKHNIPSSGIPCGVMGDVTYEPPVQVELVPGDIVLMLTDGFREAQNRAGDLFGEHRIVEVVAANSQGSASEIFKQLRREACRFADGSCTEDDMTGIIVKVLEDQTRAARH